MKSSDFKKILKDLKKKNIAILGHIGSGKSLIGRKLAKKFDINHIDSDTEIIKSTKKSINEIFDEGGEDYFRKIENKILSNILQKKKIIIS